MAQTYTRLFLLIPRFDNQLCTAHFIVYISLNEANIDLGVPMNFC